MSATNVDLGNVEYMYFRDIECNDGDGGHNQSVFSWNMPYTMPKESPFMYIQVVQLYVDHSNGAGITVPQHLCYNGIFGLNSYNSGGEQLATLMERDQLGGHWTGQSDAPMIQVPTNINKISFRIIDNITSDPFTLGDAGTIDILLKIVRPKQMDITKNTVASFAQRLP